MAFKQKAPLFFKTSIKGYRKDSPDKNEPQLKIPGNKITMKGVDHKVHGKDNFGNEKVMKPGKNYTFPGDYVVETPIKHSLPDGEDHVHDYSFDKDTKEKDFTRRDKRIYVTNKKERKKKKKKEESIPKKKKDTWYRDSDNDGNVISRAWKNRPKYKVIFNNSPMVPGFMKVVRKK